MEAQRIGWVVLLLFGFTGCASVDLNAGFPEVSAAVEERAATKIVWNRGTELDTEAEEKLRALRQKTLRADDAVQIAIPGTHRLLANVEFADPNTYSRQDVWHDSLSYSYPPLTYGVTSDPVSDAENTALLFGSTTSCCAIVTASPFSITRPASNGCAISAPCRTKSR